MSTRRTTRSQKKQQSSGAATIVVLLIIVIGAIGGIVTFSKGKASTDRVSPEKYFGTEEGRIPVAVTEGLCPVAATVRDDGAILLPYEETVEYITDKAYYDDSSGILTVATPDEILNISGEGSSRAFSVINGKVYLVLDFLTEYADIEAQQFEDPPRIVIRNRFDLPLVKTNTDTVLRTGGSSREPILCNIPAGTVLTLISRGDPFLYCSTGNGYTGYLLAETVGEEMEPQAHVGTTGEYTNISLDYPINMVFHQIYEPAANNGLLDALDGVTGINVIAPTWYFLDGLDGTMRDLSNQSYVETAHTEGLLVFATANDFDGNLSSPEETLSVLSKTKVRQAMEEQIVESVLASKADGICIDFEKVREECAEPYIMFIREMSVLCRENKLILSVCNYVPQPYNRYLNFEEQGKVADYLVIMAYDEHYSGSESAGSVSSISWVRDAVNNTLEMVSAEKVIIAIPFYTRLWETVEGKTPTCTAMGMTEAQAYVTEHGMRTVWDEETKQNYAELTGTKHYQMWLEDEQSIMQKMRVISSAHVAGVAEWKLGLEDPVVWNVIESYLQ